MTRLAGPALRLTVLVGERDTWHHRPLYSEIVHRAHEAGLAGASVFRGIEGFGGASLVHTTRLLSLGDDLPVAVLILDTEERVRGFLPRLEELVSDDLVFLEACEVVHFASGTGGAGTGSAPEPLPEPEPEPEREREPGREPEADSDCDSDSASREPRE